MKEISDLNLYHDCKLTCANALLDLKTSAAKMKKIRDNLGFENTDPRMLAASMAAGRMLKAIDEAEKALMIFVEADDALGQ